MKKKIVLFLQCVGFIASTAFAQNKEAGTEMEAIKQRMTSNDTIPSAPVSSDIQGITGVLYAYMHALEHLDLAGTEQLFASNSQIYESGASEGDYRHYMEHHLMPELKGFKSFKISNYKITVGFDDKDKFAFVTETYDYTIIMAADTSEVHAHGVTTSVLKKIKKQWKILISHNSSRKAK